MTETFASDRARWLAERMELVTASDVAAVMGLNPYASRKSLLDLKVGTTPAPELDKVVAIRAGRYCESGVFDWFVADHGIAGHMVGKLYRHPDLPVLGATPDARAFFTSGPGEPVELKMGGEAQRAKWSADANTPRAWGAGMGPEPIEAFKWGEPRNMTITRVGAPLHYWVQLQVQMDVLGDTSGWVVGCVGGTSRYDVHYRRDDAFVKRMHIAVRAFWDEVIEGRAKRSQELAS